MRPGAPGSKSGYLRLLQCKRCVIVFDNSIGHTIIESETAHSDDGVMPRVRLRRAVGSDPAIRPCRTFPKTAPHRRLLPEFSSWKTTRRSASALDVPSSWRAFG